MRLLRPWVMKIRDAVFFLLFLVIMENYSLADSIPLEKRLKQHVIKISYEIGERNEAYYDNLSKAESYILEEFRSFGYKPELQSYRIGRREYSNIIVAKQGKDRPNEQIVIGAHYDSCYNPGADDNASGVAGLLEISRLLSSETTARTIKFVAFVNEEPPYFQSAQMGSYIYARMARERKEDIKAVIILEMIGYYSQKRNSQSYPPFFGMFYPDTANFIALVGNFRSRELVQKISGNFKKNSDFPVESVVAFSWVPGVDFSDHWSFWKFNFPAVMITDTAFYRYSHYHSITDTYEKLDYNSMSFVVEGLYKVIKCLAND